MSLLPVAEALARVLAGIEPTDAETVSIIEAAGRVVASPLAALRTQPPWPTSAMDGYAVRRDDVTSPAQLSVIGQSAAGHAFGGMLAAGQAVRIFTGAPLPEGADTIVMQEDVEVDGNTINVPATDRGRFVRPRGLDFSAGDELVPAGARLGAATLALAAAMGHAQVPVRRKPRFAILATGDELVLPGNETGPDQIIASNNYGVAAMVSAAGAQAADLGIAPDNKPEIAAKLREGMDAGADVIVTTGGASVGDHDLVLPVLKQLGVEIGFWKVAMRPGKPLMMGRRGRQVFVGLPGNPVSALVCTRVFVIPMVRALLGLPATEPLMEAELGSNLPENDQRQDYLRATLEHREGRLVATPFSRQDSSMLATLARARALIVRPPHAPAAQAGTPCRYLPIDPAG